MTIFEDFLSRGNLYQRLEKESLICKAFQETHIKTLYEYDAINITLGLPFIRISPDHGPNETMLGKNLSNPLSLLRAIKFLDRN